MEELVSHVAEYVGGDHHVKCELFWNMFNDLSATNQEKYIKQLKEQIDSFKTDVNKNSRQGR